MSSTKIATTLTDWMAPWIVIIITCLAVAWHATGTLIGTLWWAAVVAVFTSVIPMGIIHMRKRRGQLTDIHIHHREHRIVPLIGITISAACGLAVMYVADAPSEVVALAWVLLVGVLATGAITAMWKISFHTAVASAAVVTMAVLYDVRWLAAYAAVAAIAWSRVKIQDHTIAQVSVGTALGAVTTSAVYLIAMS